MTLGTLGADFISSRNFAAYLPARHVKGLVQERRLYYVPDAPVFPFPIWSVWRDDLDDRVAKACTASLRSVARSLDALQEEVIEHLEGISADGELVTLGDIFPSGE